MSVTLASLRPEVDSPCVVADRSGASIGATPAHDLDPASEATAVTNEHFLLRAGRGTRNVSKAPRSALVLQSFVSVPHNGLRARHVEAVVERSALFAVNTQAPQVGPTAVSM